MKPYTSPVTPIRLLLCAALASMALTVAVYDMKGQSSRTPDVASTPDTWSAGGPLPGNLVRAVGVYFSANGRFYAVGGRSSDAAGSDSLHPFQYDPATNAWVTKVATFPDNQVNNMACAVLTVGGAPQIYCVGGSAAGATVAAARVFSYDPIADVITPLTVADNWPGNMGTVLPGGFAVVANKLYIMGGYAIGVASTQETWQFDPNALVGMRWTQKLNYPVKRSYIPAVAIGNFIYTAGGANILTPTTISDSNDSFRYDPAADTWTPITLIPRATGETRALAVNTQMWVLGGGRTAPNPSNQVDIYNPGTNTWGIGQPFVTPRRNFPADTDGARVWLANGYDTTGTGFVTTTERFLAPMATSAVSRKTHGGAGNFDINLPQSAGSIGIECRSSGGAHTILVTFPTTVTVGGATVITGTGSATASAAGSVVTVNLTGVTNAQRLTVLLNNVNDGTNTGDVPVTMGVLAGDTNGNGSCNASDTSQTKGQVGIAVSAANFRNDVNVSGSINASDVSVVKANTGTALPP